MYAEHYQNNCIVFTPAPSLSIAFKKYMSTTNIRDMFHVYLNKFEFRFLRLHVNKTNKFCFFVLNGRVFGIAK